MFLRYRWVSNFENDTIGYVQISSSRFKNGRHLESSTLAANVTASSIKDPTLDTEGAFSKTKPRERQVRV